MLFLVLCNFDMFDFRMRHHLAIQQAQSPKSLFFKSLCYVLILKFVNSFELFSLNQYKKENYVNLNKSCFPCKKDNEK